VRITFTVAMTGYAHTGQKTAGIHMRIFARAFVIAERQNPSKRVVYVNVDTWSIAQAVKLKVVERLNSTLYTIDNVLLSAIHSHATSGGYDYYTLYNVPTLGFNVQNFEAVVQGIVQAIQTADSSLSNGGRILMNSGNVLNANSK
jgi:neutral ceramidase